MQLQDYLISPWIYGPIIFFLWLIAAYSAKGILFSFLSRWGQKIHGHWEKFLIDSLKLPLDVLILGIAVALLERLLPLPAEFDQPVVLAVKVIVILAVFIFLDRLVMEALKGLSSKIQWIDLSGSIIRGLVRLTVFSIGLMILVDAMGISITPLVASLGIGSLAVALGLQETLSNLIAGLYILAEKPVRVGDFIRLESGEEGYVTEIGWRNTRLRTLPNFTVILPNSRIISSTLKNYYLPDKEMAALMEVGVHYGSDLKKVEEVTIDVARKVQKSVKGGVQNFDPFIRYHTFADSSINFTVILRVQEFTDQYLLKHEFIKALHERYKQEDITIPYPIRTLEMAPFHPVS